MAVHTHTPSLPSPSQAMMNVVNRSGQMLTQLFTGLDRRLKSADKKKDTIFSLATGGHQRGDVHRRMTRDENR